MKRGSVVARWGPAAGLLVVAVWSGTTAVIAGDVAAALVTTVGLIAVAWVVSPVFAPNRRRFADAQEVAAGTVPVILWRPGCFYCARLRFALGRAAHEALWVNIWSDDDAASYVRSVNDGDETVPTVITAGAVRTNPPPSWVRRRLDVSRPSGDHGSPTAS